MTPPTEQDTFMHIIGSGALSHSWYTEVESADVFTDAASDKPEDFVGWWVRWVDQEDNKQYTVDHGSVMGAMRRMMKAKDNGRPEWVSDTASAECRHFLFDRDECDFDAETADEVIQVAAFGHVVYG